MGRPAGRFRPIIVIIGQCVVLEAYKYLFNSWRHSVDVPGATGSPEYERPQGRKQPAQVMSDGKRTGRWPKNVSACSIQTRDPAGFPLDWCTGSSILSICSLRLQIVRPPQKILGAPSTRQRPGMSSSLSQNCEIVRLDPFRKFADTRRDSRSGVSDDAQDRGRFLPRRRRLRPCP
jgi:hypothetical protein